MKRVILIALIASSATAADWTKLRRIGLAAGCAASLIDAATTLRPGVVETNPLLGRGRPAAGRIIGVKLGLCAGQALYSELRHARYRREYGAHADPDAEMRAERGMAILGFGQAGLFGAVSAHNLRLATPGLLRSGPP